MVALKRGLEAAGKDLFKYCNDPMWCFLYFHEDPYFIQQKELDVHRALRMMANLTTI